MLAWCRDATRARVGASTRGWSDADWQAARFAVQVHGVGPLLHVRLAERMPADGAGGHAAAFLRYLAHCHEMNVQRHALWRSELERLLAAAAGAGIPIVAIKGAALLPHYWPDPALRPTSDIDLLARPEDRPAVDETAAGLGWTLHGAVPRHRVYYLARLGTAAREEVGEHPAQPLRLEIHEHAGQAFLGLRHDVTEMLWTSASASQVGDAPVLQPALAPLFEHVLIHTAFDLAKRLTRFIKLEDLRLLGARLSPGDWEGFVARAGAFRLERFYLAPLLMLERYMDTPVPADVRRRLARGTPRALLDRLLRTPLSYFTACATDGRVAQALARLRWLPPRRRLSAARRMLVPSREERLEEFTPAGDAPTLWAYYRAQLVGRRR